MRILKKRFDLDEKLIKSYFHPYIYLGRELITHSELSLAQVQKTIAIEVEKLDGVAVAIASADIESGSILSDYLHTLVANNHNINRLGNI